ncbi:hypothetical protein KNO15_00045 [Leifsonia shinshuensis]|uniref:hypothetical protein n=1 Tax=Leifsonia shinshuensis TaxID=150026 RepID=UPI001F50D905|nr:hypothetical protein [Leifsonia shinshuensis]MCI0155093.1 hypothetical protein [Leifsonia shinshuensis]
MSRARVLAVVLAGIVGGAALPAAVAGAPALACPGWGSTWASATGFAVAGTVGSPLASNVLSYDSGLSSALTLDSVSPDPATLGLTVTSQQRTTAGLTGLDITITGTPTHAGTHQLTFTVAGLDVGCGAGTESKLLQFSLAQGSQSIALPAPAATTRAGQTVALPAVATSGLPVTYSVAPAGSTVCSVSGSTLSFLTAGTCTVDAAQAGDSDWLAATAASVSYTVLAAAPPADPPAPAAAAPAPPADPGPQLAATGLPVAPLVWLAVLLAAIGCVLRFAPTLAVARDARPRRRS